MSFFYDSEQLTVAKSYVKNWEKNKKRNSGLLFWGDVGTGKSYLAACIANALIDQEVSVRMITLADVLNHKLEDRAEFIQELCSPSLLILDDFGMERDTSFGIEIVSFVVNTRVQMNKPLILTTNLSYDEIKNAQDTELPVCTLCRYKKAGKAEGIRGVHPQQCCHLNLPADNAPR